MKKRAAFFLVMSILFAMVLSSCAGDATESKNVVTLYIPESVTSYYQTDEKADSFFYQYEEGWENKESFTVNISLGTTKQQITFGDKHVIINSDVGEVDYSETYYNDRGLVIVQTTYFTQAHHTSKQETSYTYDGYGRIFTITSKIYQQDGTILETSLTYTYEETAEGSIGTAVLDDSNNYVVTYDRNHRQISAVSNFSGTEMTRTEYTYDSHGNRVGIANYMQGELVSRNETVYKAVQVTRETAQRLPQFRNEG